MAAADRVGGQAATLLRRLAVEASDADTDDVVAGVVRLAADRVVRDLQLDARHASSVEDRQGFAQAIAWLKTQSEQLSERSTREAAVDQLLPWLNQHAEEGSVTDIAPTVPLPEPAAAEFRALLSGAGVSGRLSLDALVNALPDVEFNTELIESLQAACAAAGVVLDEANESPVPDEIQVPERPDGAGEPGDGEEAPVDAERVARAAAFAATIGDDVEAPSRRSRPSRTRTSDGGSSDDPVRMYLKEIGRVPLLDARQEVRVAARIKRGLEASEHLAVLEECGEIDRLL